MSLRVGELHALLRLDSREFEQGLRRGEQQMRTFGQRVEQMIQRSQEFERATRRVGLALTGLVGSLMLATHQATAYADRIDTVHQQTGIAIRTVEGLAFAAQQANADFETLGIGLRAFARRVAEAAQGNEQFLQWFERLGISQQHLQENLHDLEGLLMVVSDRMAGLETEAEAASIAMGLMSDAGRRLAPFLRLGSSGIQELTRQFEAMGAATDERAIRALAQLNSDIDATRALFSAAGRQIVVDFLPAIQQIHERVDRLARAFLNLDEEQRQQIVRWAGITAATMGSVTAMGLLVGVLGRVGQGLLMLGTLARRHPLVLLGVAATGVALSFEEVRVKLNELARTLGLGEILDELEDLQRAFESMAEFEVPDDSSLRIRETYRQLLEEARRGLAEGRVGLESEIEDVVQQIRDTFAETLEDIAREHSILHLARVFRVEGAGELEAQIRLLQRELDAHLAALVDLRPHVDVLGDEYRGLEDRVRELVRAIKSLREEQEALAEAERKAADEAARRTRIMEAAERFTRLERGEIQRLERLLATARGDVAVELTVQHTVLREIESVIADFIREGLEPGVFAFDVAIEQLERQSAKLRELELDARLREIAREAERSLGPMLEFRELLAAITGEEFDPALFEMRVLEQQILSTALAMFDAGKGMEEIRAATNHLVDAYYDASQRVKEAAEELADAQATEIETINWVNVALDGMARGLGKNQRALAEFLQALRWESGGLVLRPEGLVGSVFTFIGSAIGNLLGGGDVAYRRPAFVPGSLEIRPGREVGVAGLRRDIRRLEEELARRIQFERESEGFVQHMSGQWWNPSQQAKARAQLEDARRLVDEARKALEDAQKEIPRFLGIDPGSLSVAIEQGFERANIEGTLENTIRTALLRAWSTSEVMLRIQEQFGKLTMELVDQFLETGQLKPEDLDPLRDIIGDLAERGDAFRRILDELGLAAEDLAAAFGSVTRNLPRGFRVERYRFEATFGTPPVPSFAEGGYIPATPGGRIVRVAEGGEGEFIVPESRMGVGGVSIVIQRMHVQDGRDFGRRLDQELRRRGLVQTGNPMGGRRLR